jgi:hypothetical protein
MPNASSLTTQKHEVNALLEPWRWWRAVDIRRERQSKADEVCGVEACGQRLSMGCLAGIVRETRVSGQIGSRPDNRCTVDRDIKYRQAEDSDFEQKSHATKADKRTSVCKSQTCCGTRRVLEQRLRF